MQTIYGNLAVFCSLRKVHSTYYQDLMGCIIAGKNNQPSTAKSAGK